MRGARTERVLAALREDPGLTYGELAERTGLDVRVLYAILGRLQDERAVVNEGRRWFPRDEAAA